jgi:serpin B
METTAEMGYASYPDFAVLAIPYAIRDLQLLVIIPKASASVAELESRLSAHGMSDFAELPPKRVRLFLPRFKIDSPTISLSPQLEALGMKAAFQGVRADFRRIDSRRDLYITDVFHKVFIVVDEQGTEAAAATAAVFGKLARKLTSPPLEVRVDRPFVFAVQHRPSGACLFLGHINDPAAPNGSKGE